MGVIPVHSFADQPVAVFGLGRSGLAAAQSLQLGGAEVRAWDDAPAARAQAASRGLPLADLGEEASWSGVAALVLSPGIPHTHPAPHPVAARARMRHTPIIGDIDLLGRACPDARYIGVTGTNGKSTTTALIGHIFAAAGRRVETGGNLGIPALELAPLDAGGTYVLEMSSYQLELTFSITFDVAVLLNMSADHLGRHGGLEGYVAAKRAIFRNQSRGRTAVVGVDDEICRRICDDLAAERARTVIPISSVRRVEGGVYVLNGALHDEWDGGRDVAMDLSEVATLRGVHNWQNAAAAFAVCRADRVPVTAIAEGIRSFPGLAHRLEQIAVIDGVRYVNDSKATNAEAAAQALACFEQVLWIAGGLAKEGGIAGLADYWPRIAHAFLIGEAAEEFSRTLGAAVPHSLCGDLSTAVAAAHATARPGDLVLLSPACASFDQFKDFEARGEAFRALVEALR
jgi:UDP-N-acetylmuramoylalanine--D-glutamate ligase